MSKVGIKLLVSSLWPILLIPGSAPKTNEAAKKPSLRRDKSATINDDPSGLNVTPEFKTYVAGKLAELIDK